MKPARRGGFFAGWRDVGGFFSDYWRAYGGWISLSKSPYLHISIVITGVTHPLWLAPDWWNVILSVIPSILGFTIGGFAIVLALGTGDFGAALSSASKPDQDPLESGLGKLGAAFCHFIVVQFAAAVFAILAMAFAKAPAPVFAPWLSNEIARSIFWGFGWFLGIYSLSLAISTTQWIFSSIKLLIRFQKLEEKKQVARKAIDQQQASERRKP